MDTLFGRVTQKKEDFIEISYGGGFFSFKEYPKTPSLKVGDWVKAHLSHPDKIDKLDCLQKTGLRQLGPLWNRFHRDCGRIRKRLEFRARALREIRDWFQRKDFLEVETPSLVPSPGMEPHLFSFETEYVPHPDFRHQEKERAFSLPTSPEFHMKRLLVAGFPKIYQLARCFRNGEHSDCHEPEFTMLEFYRSNAHYLDLIEDTKELISSLSTTLGVAHSFTKDQWEIKTVSEVFKKHTGYPLPEDEDLRAYQKIAQKLNLAYPRDCDSEGIFFLIFLNFIEAHLGFERPLILKDYPPSMAALSQINSEQSPPYAERFEVYIRGVECGNGFTELRDWNEQVKRFEKDQDLREKQYGKKQPEDEGFIEALKEGLPPCSGIAIGFERLLMALEGSKSIQEYLSFPHRTASGKINQ